MKLNPTIREIVNAWVNDVPKNNSPMIVLDDENSATCRADFFGDDNSDPAATGKEIYSNPDNLPTAVASIMNHNQKRADFHPSESDPVKLFKSFEGYVFQVDDCPFLHLVKSDLTKQSFESSDYNKLIDGIIKLYDGIKAEDKEKMKEQIADLGRSVFNKSGSDVIKNLFSETTVFMDDKEPMLYLYFTQLRMTYENPGAFKPDVNKQSYTVNRAQYKILPELIRTYADTLAKLDKKNVDDWLTESTTKERPEAKICFKLKPYQDNSKHLVE